MTPANPFEQRYRRRQRARRREALLWSGVLVLALLASARMSEVSPSALLAGLPRACQYFANLVPDLRWRQLADGPQTDVVGRMMDLGLRVTINSDDPAYFGGYIAENLALVQRDLGLGPEGLATLSRNAFEAAWLPRAAKDRYLAMVDAYLAA